MKLFEIYCLTVKQIGSSSPINHVFKIKLPVAFMASFALEQIISRSCFSQISFDDRTSLLNDWVFRKGTTQFCYHSSIHWASDNVHSNKGCGLTFCIQSIHSRKVLRLKSLRSDIQKLSSVALFCHVAWVPISLEGNRIRDFFYTYLGNTGHQKPSV